MTFLRASSRVRARAIRLSAVLLAAVIALSARLVSAEIIDPVKEAQVKAGFLVNFLRYTTFPETPVSALELPYQLVVVGDPRLADALQVASASGITINSRVLRVHVGSDFGPDDVARLLQHDGGVHLLFIGSRQQHAAPELIAALGQQPVLTVGEGPDFLAAGGMLGLRSHGRRIVFDVNPDALQDCGLKLSAKVLKLARNLRDSAVTP